ncbi:MAG: LamG domain-containing protein, partial [Patescibacteria group bacterium]|nr:LamG domain-containing protein [Patescibacteria group bacterium]
FLGVTDYAGSNDYRLFVWAGDSTIPNRTGTTVLTKGEWHHVAMTRQGDDVRVYLDGLQEISVTLPSLTGLNWSAGTWTFGGRRDLPGQQKFAGNLDEIAVYAGAKDGLGFQENYLSAIVQRDVPYAKTTLSFSPESYWRLNETSPYTLAIDATGHGHTFTYHAAASRTGVGNDVGPAGDVFIGFGADNNAPRLAATTVGIVEGVLANQNDYSAQMWFSPGNSAHAYGHYLLHRGTGQDNGDYLGVQNGSDKLYVFNGTSVVVGNTALTKGQWYHLGMTREGNTVTVYLNGQPEITTTLAAKTGLTTGQWAFGGRSDTPPAPLMHFTGNLDEIALYGRSLSKFHVQASYLSALARDECDYSNAVMAHGPQAYWRLNESSEWVAAMDSSGNAHHFEYQASAQRGIAQMGPTPASAMLGFEAGNTAPRLTGSPTGSLTNGYLGIATGVLPGQNDYTAEMWLRRDAVGSLGAYLMHRNDLDATTNTGDYLGLQPSAGEINLFVYDGATSTVGSTEILEDQWHHVAMVRQGNEVLVYLDGQLEIESTIAPRSGTKWVDGIWAFGGRTDIPALNQRFAGSMDEIAIYGYALSLAEIRAHYLVGVPEPSTGLLLALACLSLAARRRR